MQATAEYKDMRKLGRGIIARGMFENFVRCIMREGLVNSWILVFQPAKALLLQSAKERGDAGSFAEADAVRRFDFVEGQGVSGCCFRRLLWSF